MFHRYFALFDNCLLLEHVQLSGVHELLRHIFFCEKFFRSLVIATQHLKSNLGLFQLRSLVGQVSLILKWIDLNQQFTLLDDTALAEVWTHLDNAATDQCQQFAPASGYYLAKQVQLRLNGLIPGFYDINRPNALGSLDGLQAGPCCDQKCNDQGSPSDKQNGQTDARGSYNAEGLGDELKKATHYKTCMPEPTP